MLRPKPRRTDRRMLLGSNLPNFGTLQLDLLERRLLLSATNTNSDAHAEVLNNPLFDGGGTAAINLPPSTPNTNSDAQAEVLNNPLS